MQRKKSAYPQYNKKTIKDISIFLFLFFFQFLIRNKLKSKDGLIIGLKLVQNPRLSHQDLPNLRKI